MKCTLSISELSIPKFVSIFSIWPVCFSNILSSHVLTWRVKDNYKNHIFFTAQSNVALHKKHVLHTFNSLLQAELQTFERPHFSLRHSDSCISSVQSLSCHFLPLVSFLSLFAPLPLPFSDSLQSSPGAHWGWPVHRSQSSWATPLIVSSSVGPLPYSYLIHVLRAWWLEPSQDSTPGRNLGHPTWEKMEQPLACYYHRLTAHFPLPNHLLEESNHLHFENSLMRCF